MIQLYNGDVRDFIDGYNGEKFHGLLSDPPYHLGGSGFMDHDWDKGGIAFDADVWRSMRELLLPGAFALVYTGSYNYDLVAGAMRKAGFDIFPMIAWIYSQGMGLGRKSSDGRFAGYRYGKQSLKPAIEPIVCAQNPTIGSAFNNMQTFGTGALFVEGAMIGNDARVNQPAGNKPGGRAYNLSVSGMPQDREPTTVLGRYPNNVMLAEESVAAIEAIAGVPIGSYFHITDEPSYYVRDHVLNGPKAFYVKKADRKERDYGLDELESQRVGVLNGRRNGSFTDGGIPTGKNMHPTVKPISLDTRLATLIMPPDGFGERRLFNPFSGTGSEAIGAQIAGWEHITMVERDLSSVDISRRRIKAFTDIELEQAHNGHSD